MAGRTLLLACRETILSSLASSNYKLWFAPLPPPPPPALCLVAIAICRERLIPTRSVLRARAHILTLRIQLCGCGTRKEYFKFDAALKFQPYMAPRESRSPPPRYHEYVHARLARLYMHRGVHARARVPRRETTSMRIRSLDMQSGRASRRSRRARAHARARLYYFPSHVKTRATPRADGRRVIRGIASETRRLSEFSARERRRGAEESRARISGGEEERREPPDATRYVLS